MASVLNIHAEQDDFITMTATNAKFMQRFNIKRILSRWPALGAAAFTLALSGCETVNNTIYMTTGEVLKGYGKTHIVPYLNSTDDLEMACAMMEANTPLLMSFGRVTSSPDLLNVVMALPAAGCEERRGWEAELEYMRALREKRPEAATDALIKQKRHYINAASRYFSSWKALGRHFGEPGSGECPKFADDIEEFVYLAGLLSGLQALNSEIQATYSIGVPKNIGALVERAAGCLDDDEWWGVPMAMRAVVWALIPGAEPQGENAMARLAAADAKGEAAGVRLTHVMHLLAASNKGDDALVRQIIKRHVQVTADKSANADWKMVDRMATLNILAISDRMWTEATGSRTPIGGLGTFWDERKGPAVEAMDLDSIF